MNKMFEIEGIGCPVTNLSELIGTRKGMYPDMTADELKTISETAERLIPEELNYVLEEEAGKDYTKKVLLAAKKDQQILLLGPKGTGKTTCIYHLSNKTNNPLVPIQLNGATGIDTLVGKWLVNKEGTYWIDGLFTMAWKYGFWIILDELNMALPEITAVLHPALDDRRILVLDEKNGEVVPRHPNCRIFAAINPTEDYAGTKEMNAALVDRFAGQVIVDYPEARKERAIILSHKKVSIDDTPPARTKEGIVTRMVKVANALRKLHKEQKLMFECSTRNLIDRACWCEDLSIKEACDLAILSKADREDFKTIMDEVNKMFRDDEKRETKAKRAKRAVSEVKDLIEEGEIIESVSQEDMTDEREVAF